MFYLIEEVNYYGNDLLVYVYTSFLVGLSRVQIQTGSESSSSALLTEWLVWEIHSTAACNNEVGKLVTSLT